MADGDFVVLPPEKIGVAPVKAEYVITKDEILAEIAVSANREVDDEFTAELKQENKNNKKDRKGMNKHRRKDMKHAETKIRADNIRLCPSVIQPVGCKFGEKCTSEHNIERFLELKQPDIGESCPVFDVRGVCPFSFACRFGNAHTDENKQQITKDPSPDYTPTMNASSIQIQMALRKRTYDFSPSDLALQKENSIGSDEREARTLGLNDWKGKKYLAPLTTVGNLPFRRICVDFGADITCGEMALATSLLSGTPSEYSLLKRHPSEKIFGVQLAGGFADTMTKAAQVVIDNMEVDFIDINMGCPIDVVNQKGGGCALPNRPKKMYEVISSMKRVMGAIPLTVKIRTGLKEGVLTADDTIRSVIGANAVDLITLHPRSKEQRYTRSARWDFVPTCIAAASETPLWVCGDVFSWQEYHQRLEENTIGGIMVARGALIKPWIFTEIDEKRDWDISATERFDLMKKFVNYGLDHWGSDDAGVERTRRFLLEWLSFQYRYIPIGLLEVLPQRINERPPQYRGRSELETLLSSPRCQDWIEISKRLLGPTPEGFTFIPKHKASSY